jgi:membrane-bound lytic murein transglycosylase D
MTRLLRISMTIVSALAALIVIPVGISEVSAIQLLGREIAPPTRGQLLGQEVAVKRSQPLARTADTRAGAARWDLANINSARVDYWIDRFQSDKRSDFEIYLQRKGRYEDMIRARLRARGMPEDLLYLAMIESGFHPDIRSRAGAVGIWQFIAETGRRYGLRITRSVDERRDPVKSTDAALSYLQKLYNRFGSWYLAAAAYNTGENRVGRVMREEFGRERGSDLDYYRIWDRLPSETRDYVPLMIAAGRISKSPHKYGFGHVQPDAPRYRVAD